MGIRSAEISTACRFPPGRHDEWHYQSGGDGDLSAEYRFIALLKSDKTILVEEKIRGLNGGPEK